ncbi:MAG: hypothetical protein KKB19_00100, partial [Bacteroidetes bacterium]|nr:hypothetical protein [Bacteroidota bacterium]
KFKIEITDWTNIDLVNAKFILSEAKDFCKYQNDNSDKITNRAFSILSILLPIVATLIIFIVKEKSTPTFSDDLVFKLLSFVVIVLLIIMFFLSQVVFPRMFMPLGREPKDLCSSDFLGTTLKKENAQIALVLNEIEATQLKINYNKKQNLTRTTKLKWSLISIGILCLISLSIVFFHLI